MKKRMNPPQPGTMFGKYGPLYRVGAAPQAIAAHLEAARKRLRYLEAEVQWLVDLKAEREAQVERGEWPPAKTVDERKVRRFAHYVGWMDAFDTAKEAK